MEKPIRKKRFAYAALIIAAVAFACFSETLNLGQKIYDNCPKILFWNTTYSVPRGLYMMVPLGNLKVGDYVLFMGTDEIRNLAVEREWMRKESLFLKRIGALAGDEYSVSEATKFFHIKGEFMGTVRDVDSKGRELPHKVKGNQVVPPDHFLPVGDSTRSFDGRYYGPQPISTIKYRVIPIYLEN